MRSFTFTGGSSHKFWNVELQGRRLTVTFGRIGTVGQTQVKEFADESAARKGHDKLVAEKLRKGYEETGTTRPQAAPATLREALEQALRDNPDDLASHMAYADYLQEQGDPFGEFVRLQLELEDLGRSAAERKKLRGQEAKMLEAHRAEWFGELNSLLFPKAKKKKTDDDPEVQYTLRRGWIDSLEVDQYTVETTRLLARAPQLRLLRRLVLIENAYEEEGEYRLGTDVPRRHDYPQLYPLTRSGYLGNVREFILGEIPSQADEADAGSSFNCHTSADGVLGVVRLMPKLEELRLFAHGVPTRLLFALPSLENLRVLQVYHNDNYALPTLAQNASLGKLTHLLLHPHALDDEHAYIRTPAVKALVNAKNLPSLTHLQLRLSDMGDQGVKEIIASGILGRLRVFDLRHGCITDVGARALAACPDAAKLERLDLMNNSLTPAGVKALRSAGVKVEAKNQWKPGDGGDWGDGEQDYLFAGDIE